MIAAGAVVSVARREWRHAWRTILALAVVVGAMAGVTAAIATILWRTDTAFDRLSSANRLADAEVTTLLSFPTAAQQAPIAKALADGLADIAADPKVLHSRLNHGYVGKIDGPGLSYFAISAPDSGGAPIDEPVVVRGRAPLPDSADEVVISESRAKEAGFRIGQVLSVDLLTPAQYNAFSAGFGAPRGGHVDLHVVGLYRFAIEGSAAIRAGPAFNARFGRQSVIDSLLIETTDHSGLGSGPLSFAGRAAALDRTVAERFGASKTPFVVANEPRNSIDPNLAPTQAVLRAGLLGLLLVVAAAAIIVAGQLAGRWAERGRNAQAVEHALGLPARSRVAGRLLAAVPALVVALVMAVGGGLLGGAVEPLGSQRRYEPTPGWMPRPLLAVAVAVIAVLTLAALITLTALRAGSRRATRRAARTARADLPLRLPSDAAMLARALARRGGSSRSTLPRRSMVAGLAAMIAALVLVGDIERQVAGLIDSPAAWGWTADFMVLDDRPATDARLVADPRATAVDQVIDVPATVRVGDLTGPLQVYGRRPLKAALDYTIVSGRLPVADDELALGPRAAHDLGLEPGDAVDFVLPRGSVHARVVGLVVVPSLERESLGANAVMTQAGARRAAANTGFSSLSVQARDAAAAAALIRQLRSTAELITPVMPPSVQALDSLSVVTRVLLLTLCLAIALLVDQNGRVLFRRRGEQLSIAEAIGMPRAQRVWAVVLAELATSLPAGVVGAVLGWTVGRLVLTEMAPRLGVGFPSPGWLVGGAALVGAVVVTVLVAVTGAAATSRRRRRVSSTR